MEGNINTLKEYITIQDAAVIFNKTVSNISYLIQYKRINKYYRTNNNDIINAKELKKINLRVNDSFEEDEEKITITLNTPPKAIIDKPENNSLFQTTDIIEFDASSSFDPEDEMHYTWESDISGILSMIRLIWSSLTSRRSFGSFIPIFLNRNNILLTPLI